MKIQGEEATVQGEDYPHFKEFPSASLFQNQNYKTFIIYIFSYFNAMYYLVFKLFVFSYFYAVKKKSLLDLTSLFTFLFWDLFEKGNNNNHKFSPVGWGSKIFFPFISILFHM